MSEQHRATPEQWAQCEADAARWPGATAFHCLLELRDRLQSAEQRISELEGNSSAGLTGSAPAFEPPELSDEDADELWHGQHLPPWESECTLDCARRIYRAGWDAAMAAQNLRQEDESAERAAKPAAPAGSLVEVVEAAARQSGGCLARDEWSRVILAVADWIEQRQLADYAVVLRDVSEVIGWLREEVERG